MRHSRGGGVQCRGATDRMDRLKTYTAGLGATAALLGAGVVVFVALAALVATGSLPGGPDGVAGGRVIAATSAPEAAAAAALGRRSRPGAVQAPTAASGTPAAPGSGRGSTSGAGPGSGTPPAGAPSAPPSAGTGPGTAPSAIAPSPPAPAGGGPRGTTGSIVDQIDETVREVTGVDPGLSEAAKPITDIVDGGLGKVAVDRLPQVGTTSTDLSLGLSG